MQIPELEKVGINDIEKLIRLADDVVRQMERNLCTYDEYGLSFQNEEQELNEHHQKECEEIKRLVREIIREEQPFTEVYYGKVSPIRARVEPHKNRIIGIFRNGALQDTVTNETNYCADDSVSDEYLMELFVMRLRDRRIVSAAQRFPKSYFLLVKGYACCPDGDEYVGVYTNISKLREVYEVQTEMLNSESEKREYGGGRALTIFEFVDLECFRKSHWNIVKPEELWR